jgi:hypothetical protein
MLDRIAQRIGRAVEVDLQRTPLELGLSREISFN